MTRSLLVIFSLVPFYLIGAIPVGQIIAKRRGIDITTQGSGNVGAINVARALGWKTGLLVLALDVIKGAMAALLAGILTQADWYTNLAALSVVCGHCFSIPGKFKGGKGVATAFGAILVLVPPVALTSLAIYIFLFAATRLPSVASLGAALAAPAIGALMEVSDGTFYSLAGLAAVICWRHQGNISRLIEGREKRF